MANVPQNVTMNSTAFLNNVNTILSKYIPSITDSMIWWFAAQSLTTQSQLISQLCTNKIPLQAVMNRYSSINATFNLPVQIQTQMIDCVDRLSNGAAVPSFLNSKIQPSSVFLWNPFTPKSYLWFAGLNVTRQFGIIHLICMDVRFDAQFFNNTFTYYGKLTRFTKVVQDEMGNCVDSWVFLERPLDVLSREWFRGQAYGVQRAMVTRLCANSLYNYNKLQEVFGSLGSALSSTRYEAEACLTTYKMGPVQVGTTYRLDSIETLVWLTSQTASNQRLFVANVCFGFFKKGIHDYYTLLEILDILQLYSEYLLKTNGLSRSVAEKIQNCGPFYEGSTSSSIYKKELWSSTSRTWLHSQNTSIQILFINQICEDPAVNSTLTARLFYLFDLSDSVVRKVMLDCPKIQDVVGGLRLNMAIFNSIAAVSGVGAAALAMLVYYEATILVGSQSILEKVCSKFNVLLCCCFVFGGLDNVLFALFIWFKILNEVTGMAEGVQMADATILASDLFHTLWCISYLSFCWIRSESILVNVWPQTHWLIWIFFILSGIAMFGPLLSDAVFLTFKELVFKIGLRSMNTISFILEALSSCLLLLIDALLLYTFTQFVTQLQENLNLEKTQRVLIICQYGLASSIICVIYSGLGIAKPILYWNDHHGENAFRFKILTSVVSLMVTFTLLFMKLSLFFDSKRTAVTVGIMKPKMKEHSGSNGTTLPPKSSQEK